MLTYALYFYFKLHSFEIIYLLLCSQDDLKAYIQISFPVNLETSWMKLVGDVLNRAQRLVTYMRKGNC